MIRRARIIEVKSLIESHSLKQILTASAYVTRFKEKVLSNLVLETKVPLLHVRSFEITVYRPELKSFGDVSRR